MLLWLPITLALVSNLLTPTGVLLAERTLFLPSVAIALASGALAARVLFPTDPGGPLAGASRLTVTAARGAFVLLLAVAAARSAARQSAWEDNAAVISTMLADAPELFRGHLLLGETYAIHRDYGRAEPALRQAVARYPDFAVSRIDLARVLQLLGRCEEALPHFDAGLRLDPTSQVGQVSRSLCLLRTGRLHDARVRALEGLAGGASPSAFRAIRWAADSMLVATDSVDSRNLFARAGGPSTREGGTPTLDFNFVQRARPSGPPR
jgi:tetratricopeptide (TPR) repeat protein